MHFSDAFLVDLIFGCALAALFTPLAMRACKAFGLVSVSDFRRHQVTVPLAGGMAIFASTLAVGLARGLDVSLLVYAMPIFFIGLLDDRIELGAKPKFAMQLFTVSVWLYFLDPAQMLLVTAGYSPLWAKILTGFWLLGLINAMNMIDGMDGAASGFAVIAALGIYLMAPASSDSGLIMVLIGSSAGFLYFNWPQAKAYLGDTGSTTLGFMLGALAATRPAPHETQVFLAPLFLFAFPLMDAVLSILRRSFRGSNLFKGDRDHLHHKLQKVGFTVPQSLAVIYAVAAYCAASAYLCLHVRPDLMLVELPVLMAAPAMLLVAVFYIESRLARQMGHLSRSLLLTHLPVDEDELQVENCRYVVVIDLITYYKDLQNRGFLEVNTFVNDFGHLLKGLSIPYGCHVFGSYTIVLNFSDAAAFQAARTELLTQFKALLLHNGLLQTGDLLPLGLKMYTPDSPNLYEIQKLVKSFESTRPAYAQAG